MGQNVQSVLFAESPSNGNQSVLFLIVCFAAIGTAEENVGARPVLIICLPIHIHLFVHRIGGVFDCFSIDF